jgi:hypothetical protein
MLLWLATEGKIWVRCWLGFAKGIVCQVWAEHGLTIRERCVKFYPLRIFIHVSLGLMIDSQTILDYITAHPYLSKTPLVWYLACSWPLTMLNLDRLYMGNPSVARLVLTLHLETQLKSLHSSLRTHSCRSLDLYHILYPSYLHFHSYAIRNGTPFPRFH